MKDLFGNRIDILGRRLSPKEARREVLGENRHRGRLGEENVKMGLQLRGYEVERSPKGKDFIVRKRDFLSGRVISTKHIEVKTGGAKLSKLQQSTKRKKSNYQVIRNEPLWI